MTYRVRIPGTGGDLEVGSREEAPEVLGAHGMRLLFAQPGPPRRIGERRRRQERAAAEFSAARRRARASDPAAPGRGPGPGDEVLDDEGV